MRLLSSGTLCQRLPRRILPGVNAVMTSGLLGRHNFDQEADTPAGRFHKNFIVKSCLRGFCQYCYSLITTFYRNSSLLPTL